MRRKSLIDEPFPTLQPMTTSKKKTRRIEKIIKISAQQQQSTIVATAAATIRPPCYDFRTKLQMIMTQT